MDKTGGNAAECYDFDNDGEIEPLEFSQNQARWLLRVFWRQNCVTPVAVQDAISVVKRTLAAMDVAEAQTAVPAPSPAPPPADNGQNEL
jgi:hypothetical protein